MTLVRYPPKRLFDLRENARRKILCDVNIFNVCLNMSNLPEIPQFPVVVFAPYSPLYK